MLLAARVEKSSVVAPEPAEAEIWATTVKVTVAPGTRLTVVLMLPVPLVWATLAPAEATAVQLALVMAAGRLSSTGAPVTARVPLLPTTMLYVVLPPGV